MRGLILKDLYLIKGFGRQYAFVFVFMAIWGIAMKATSFLCIYATLMGAMIVLSITALDDAVSFNRFALTMPVSVRTLIKSKYLLFIITLGIGTAIALLISGIAALLSVEMNQEFSWQDLVPSVTVFVVGTSIALPVILYRGAEKGRYAYMAAMLGLGGLMYGVIKLCQKYKISLDFLETIPIVLFVGIFAGICIISLVISYFVTLRLVRKKEW